mgnify:CR=1 FL=1
MRGSLLDSNLWVAATFPSHEFHAASLAVLQAATPSKPVLFCRATEQSFLRLVTSPQIIARYGADGMTNRHALAVLETLQARPEVEFRAEAPGLTSLWHQLANRNSASAKVWMDAYLAAFAISGELEFVTLDRDFHAYTAHGLRLRLLAPERA